MTAANTDPAASEIAHLEAPLERDARLSGTVASAASLLWIGQAYAAANLIGHLVKGGATTVQIVVFALVYLGFGAARSLLDAAAAKRIFDAAQAMVRHQRQQLTETASLASPLSPSLPSSAEVATLIANKLDLLIPWATHFKVAAIKVRLVPIGILAAVLTQSWLAALILVACGPLIPLFMALVGYAARDAAEKQLAEQASMNGLLLEWLNAGADIRIFNAENRTATAFADTADQLRVRTMAVLRIAFLSSTVLEFFAALGIALTAVYVGFSLLGVFQFGAYGEPLSPTSGIFVLLMVPDFFQPLRDLASAWHDRAAATAVAGEIAKFKTDHANQILGKGDRSLPSVGAIAITGHDLAVALPQGGVLTFPEFSILAGEAVAITGSSGSGKSTLLALFCGLITPSTGSLTVCGSPLNDATADAWRRRIGYIGQHPHLINASVRQNIALAGRSAEAKDVMAALEAARADEVVGRLPRGLGERLGENGAGVSGGEARRLMIARAIAADCDIIIADEPTADLDEVTAKAITDTLLNMKADGKTLIIATHDARLVARMDRLIDLRAER